MMDDAATRELESRMRKMGVLNELLPDDSEGTLFEAVESTAGLDDAFLVVPDQDGWTIGKIPNRLLRHGTIAIGRHVAFLTDYIVSGVRSRYQTEQLLHRLMREQEEKCP